MTACPITPKVMPLTDAGFRLLVTGWCWCSRYLTDGVMPMEVWSRFGNKRGRDELVRTAHVHLASDGQSVSFHDYLDHQRSRAQVEDLRKKRAEAGRKGGKAGSKTEASALPSDTDVAKQNESIVREQRTETEVLPTEAPEKTSPPAKPARVTTRFPDHFDEFWSLYPRKVQKEDARKAWTKVTRGTLPDAILAGVKRVAADPNLPEKQFIPYPATWLNAGGWDDEPFPPEKNGRIHPTRIIQRDGKGGMAWEM